MQVELHNSELSHELLQAAGASVQFTRIPGMPHTVFPDELDQLLAFWKDVLPALKAADLTKGRSYADLMWVKMRHCICICC